ncbi:MAG: tetratricopeptide repeat protein [Bacteroidia bacterium]|nr:tetratricopeptide repeat protein [Bacteroidia bacterium]
MKHLLFQRAAEEGDADAQYNLGVMYYFGDAGEKDFAKAFVCFRKAADAGYAQAQYNLAGMYYFGEGTEKDVFQAFNYYSKAAENGFSDAWKNLGDMYLNGDGIQKNVEKAILSFEKSADSGDDEARYELGRILYTTTGYQDFTKAILHLKAAAENSYAPAYNLLGVVLVSKKLSERDPVAAWHWFEKGAEEGIITAKLNKATYLKRGENGVVDYNKAYNILEELEQDDQDRIAAYLLALLILSGECEVKDQEVARKYLELSSRKGWKPADKFLDNNDLFTGPAVLNFWEDYILEDTED